jgi:cytidylate kinase
MSEIVIAIDGYSACGKSTTARLVAKNLGYLFIDTGAMYRAVTLFFMQNDIYIEDSVAIQEALNFLVIEFKNPGISFETDILLNGIVVNQQIREMEVSSRVSQVSAISEVRRKLVAQQQEIGKSKAVVMDGRDIGTVVFPEAELKIFMVGLPKSNNRWRKSRKARKSIYHYCENFKNIRSSIPRKFSTYPTDQKALKK